MHLVATLTAVAAAEILEPWGAGPARDYSDNENFAVGENITIEWVASFSNATIRLNQESRLGDADSPRAVLEGKFSL